MTGPSQQRSPRVRMGVAALAFAALVSPAAAPQRHAAAVAAAPDLGRAVAYLVAPANLVDGHSYELFPGFADFGLTIDGAFALAATGTQDSTLRAIADFVDNRGTDGSGRSVDDWTGLGTPFASGGSVGKEALLAEVVGRDPHAFGGHDLVAALDALVCTQASTAPDTSCAAAGNYQYAQSVFGQAMGVVAQLRAGDSADAGAPIAYLEGLQHSDGSWPSLIPAGADSDVDSTAMAVMALALVPGQPAADAVGKGIAWIAAQQSASGGFPGTAADSTNSTALAIQGLSLDAAAHGPQIASALTFLAGEQNSDGGFDIAATGQQGSDLRASTQAVSGAVGISAGVLFRDLGATASPSPTPTSPSPTPSATSSATSTASSTASSTPTATSSPSTGALPPAPEGGDPGTGVGGLADTGADLGGPLAAAGVLLLAGTALVVAARLRPRPVAGRRH